VELTRRVRVEEQMELVEVLEPVGQVEGEERIPRFPSMKLRLKYQYTSSQVHGDAHHWY